MSSSADDWNARHGRGGYSGAGSFGRLAKCTADCLNTSLEDNKVGSVLAFGCGEGFQFVDLRPERYVGFDISPAAVAVCRQRLSGKPALSFFTPDDNADLGKHVVALSSDDLHHLIEIEVVSAV